MDPSSGLPPLILASTSPWRRKLLARLGLPFEAIDPRLDERPWMEAGDSPEDLVVQLAEAKARAVAYDLEGPALVLGADQVATIDATVLGKPGNREGAIEQLMTLAGRTHRLVTGLALLSTSEGILRTTLDIHHVTLRELSRAQIEDYVDREDVTRCAGSYRVEGLGISLFESVRGDDYTAVIGLPLVAVTSLLTAAGRDPLAGGSHPESGGTAHE